MLAPSKGRSRWERKLNRQLKQLAKQLQLVKLWQLSPLEELLVFRRSTSCKPSNRACNWCTRWMPCPGREVSWGLPQQSSKSGAGSDGTGGNQSPSPAAAPAERPGPQPPLAGRGMMDSS